MTEIDLGAFFRFVGLALSSSVIVFGALWTVLRPALDTLLFGALERNKEKFKRLSDEVNVSARATVDMVARETAAALTLSASHTAALVTLNATAERQAATLAELPRMSESFALSAQSLTMVSKAMESLAVEVKDQGLAFAKLQGFLETAPWNQRRSSPGVRGSSKN